MKPLELPGLVTKGDESAWALTSEDTRVLLWAAAQQQNGVRA